MKNKATKLGLICLVAALSFLLGFATLFTSRPVFAEENTNIVSTGTEVTSLSGEGTIDNPYVINNLDDLIYFRNQVNTGNNYAKNYIKLESDIDLSSISDWTPIGNTTNAFQGYFDGNYKTISNLTVLGSNDYAGFFGYIKGEGMSATTTPSVKDLTLDNVNVSGNYYVGGLAGQGFTCNITGVTVKGNVSATRYVGGLVGHVYTYFKDCHFNGTAYCSFDALGGIAGAGDCRAYDCSVIGTISGSNWVGGVIGNGQEGTSAVGCYVKATVSTDANFYFGVGGIAGVGGFGGYSGEFKENYFDGEVFLCGQKVNAIVMGFVNADSNDEIIKEVSGNSWNSECYPVDTPVLVGAPAISNATPEEWAGLAAQNLTTFRNNNLVVLESDIQYVDAIDVNDVVIKDFSSVTGVPAVETEKIEDKVITNKYSAKVGDQYYTDFNSALTAANSLTGDVVVEIYAKVTLNQSLSGAYDKITFVGKTDNAEIYLDVQGYITAQGKKLAFEDLKLSKSVGGFMSNAGFMNVAFGVFNVDEVTYTDCYFMNGACASSGMVSFNGCTFKRSHEKYCLWAYGNVDVTVNNCIFDDYRGIKMYAEGKAKTVELTVKDSDFSACDSKPAIVLTYGESVELAGNTYSSTGVFELDKDGDPNGTRVSADISDIACMNDNYADCGVIVDGKIYTTLAAAADAVQIGSTVTLMYEPDASEAVELPYEVTLNKNGYQAESVVVKTYAAQIGAQKFGTIQEALDSLTVGNVQIDVLKDTDENIVISQAEGKNIILNGNGMTFGGRIYIHGNNRSEGAETLVIKNFNFVAESGDPNYSVIESNNSKSAIVRYAHNITIKDSSFTAIGAAIDSAASIKLRQAYNVAIENVTLYDMHSVLQAYGITGVTVDGVTVVSGKNGISVGTSTGAVIKNVDINVSGYGIRADGDGARETTIENSTISANLPVVVRKVTKKYTVNIADTNLVSGSGYGVTFTAGDDEDPLVVPSVAVELNATSVNGLNSFMAVAENNGATYSTLNDAIANAQDGDVVKLFTDITLDDVITIDKAITLDLNGFTVTGGSGKIVFNVKADTIITNGSIIGNKSGTSSGLIDIYSNLTLNYVKVETSKIVALRFKAGGYTATLTDCEVTGQLKGYGASVWKIRGGTYKASSTAISEQLNGTAQIFGGVFHYSIKDINCVDGYKVVDNADGTYGVVYAPAGFVDTNNNGVQDNDELLIATLEQVFDVYKEGNVYVVLTGNIQAKTQVDTNVNAHYYFTTNVAAGVTMDFLFADDWNYIQNMTIGSNITINVPYILIWSNGEIAGTINTDYLYITGANVIITEDGVVNANTGDATVQVKNGAKLTVNGELSTSILNVWVGESKLIVSGANAKVNVAHVDIWDGEPSVTIENGATIDVANIIKASRGGEITVDNATLNANNIELGHNGSSEGKLEAINGATISGEIKLTAPDSTFVGGEGLNVVSTLEWYLVDYNNGVYSLAKVVAKIGEQKFITLKDAIASVGAGDVIIDLYEDVDLSYGAREAYGLADTTSITINGNGNVITLNQTNSDWSSIGMKNANGKFIINDATVNKTGYGATGGAWNTHAVIFHCAVEMNNVTFNNSIAVNKGAILNDVTINEANGFYGLWISANGQEVEMNGGAINATNGGRGIKIADQYIDDVKTVELGVTDTVFNTAKKAAILITSNEGANVALSNVDISNVQEDSTNAVMVDEDRIEGYNKTEVTGGEVRFESETNIVATIDKQNKVQYYSTIQNAIDDAEAGDTVALVKDVALAKGLVIGVDQVITIDLNGKTISRTTDLASSTATISNSGNLTIIDSVGGGKITAVALNPDNGAMPYYANNTITNGGVLTIKGGTIENATDGKATYAIDNNSTNRDAIVNVEGGIITARVAIRQFANSTVNKNEVIVNGGEILGSNRAIWVQLPGSDASKAVKVSTIINGGELTSLDTEYNLAIYVYSYGNSASETVLKISDGTFNGDVAIYTPNEGIQEGNIEVTGGTFNGAYGVYAYYDAINLGFISGGTFAGPVDEVYWKPGFVIIPQNGAYVAMDMAEFSILVEDYLREIADQIMSERVYSDAGVRTFDLIITSYCSGIPNMLYMSEVERVYQTAIEMFAKVLTAIEAQELAIEYILDAKVYAELKQVDFDDQRIIDACMLMTDSAFKMEMQQILANIYTVIDLIAEENAQALKDAKDAAILELVGANGENANNVTSSMLTSIYVANTVEDVQAALNIAKVELQEIVLYKGYIKNASEKASENATALQSLSQAFKSFAETTGISLQNVLDNIGTAITDIGKVKKDTESLLETAVNKNELQIKLSDIEEKVGSIVGDVTKYIKENVSDPLNNYVTETNSAIATLTSAVNALGGTVDSSLDNKLQAITKAIAAIKPLTKDDVQTVLNENNLNLLDGKVSALAEKVKKDNETIQSALGGIQTAITGYVTDTNNAISGLTNAVNSITGTVAGGLKDELDAIKNSISAIDTLTADEVEEILKNSTALADKVATITNRIGQIDSTVANVVNQITSLINGYKAEVDKVVAEVGTLINKADAIVSNLEGLSGTITSLEKTVKEAQAAADTAQQTADTASKALKELSDKLSANTTSIEDLAKVAAQALEAAQRAEEAARLAMEKAQTAEVKSHATVTEQELKAWLDEYLAALGMDEVVDSASNGLIVFADNITIVGPTTTPDTYRDQLIQTLAEKYNEENAALVLSYYDVAMAQIAAASSKADIDYALESFKANVSLVEYLDTLTPAPAYNDQMVIILLIVVAGVEAIIAIVAIVLLVKVSKAKKQGGFDPDDNASIEEVAVAEVVEPVVEETYKVEQVVEEAPVEQSTEAEETETAEEGDAFAKIKGNSKTFEQKLAEADVVVKQGYETIREELLKYKKVNPRISKKAVSFRKGRTLIAKMTIVGKTLRVYLALNPNAYDVTKLFHRDASDKKAYEEVPMLMRVRSGRAIKRTVKLIPDVAEKFELVLKPEPKQ